METTIRPVGAWLPIRTPVWDHPERLSTYLAARDQFIAQLPSAVATLSDMTVIETVTLESPPGELLKWFKERSFMAGTRLFEFIHIQGIAQVDQRWLRKNPDAEENVIRSVAVCELASSLELILVLTELAYPGCIDTLECALVSGSTFVNTSPKKGSHTRLGFPEQPAWPLIQMLELNTVIAWAKRTSVVRGALASTRVERALAAYSHIIGLSWHRDGELLFRAMQGLEAFYIEGTGDLRRQLSTKVQLWLGQWNENKNIVGYLYDLRSAFVHGSSRLAFWNRDGAAWDEDEKHMEVFEGHVNLAIRLLVATLQECIRRDVTSIDWSYTYKTDEASH
jgi:hypothetical protein